jgi:hypothetical protein
MPGPSNHGAASHRVSGSAAGALSTARSASNYRLGGSVASIQRLADIAAKKGGFARMPEKRGSTWTNRPFAISVNDAVISTLLLHRRYINLVSQM